MSMNSNYGEEGYVFTPKDWGAKRTKESFAEEANINNIIRKYRATGQLTHISAQLGAFRDMTQVLDLKDAMDVVAEANTAFEELPAQVRKACGHDPGNFLPWLDDPRNKDQAVEWGLLEPPAKSMPKPAAAQGAAENTAAAEAATGTGTSDSLDSTGTTDTSQ